MFLFARSTFVGSLKTRLSNWRSYLTSSLCFLPKYTLKGHFHPSSSLFLLFKHAMYCGRYRDQLTPALCWLAKLSVRLFNLNSSLQIVRLFFIWILIFWQYRFTEGLNSFPLLLCSKSGIPCTS